VPADELAPEVVGCALAGRAPCATPVGQAALIGQEVHVADVLRRIAASVMATAVTVHGVAAGADRVRRGLAQHGRLDGWMAGHRAFLPLPAPRHGPPRSRVPLIVPYRVKWANGPARGPPPDSVMPAARSTNHSELADDVSRAYDAGPDHDRVRAAEAQRSTDVRVREAQGIGPEAGAELGTTGVGL
jgi:hypothetical protein